MMTRGARRVANTEKRNQKLRDAFYRRFTLLPHPKKVSREYVVAQLAEEFNLSTTTVDKLLYVKNA